MHFIVTGYDGTDEKALERRLAARGDHMKLVEHMVKEKKYLYATALLSDEGKMIGSVLIVDFPSKKELDQWLEEEPYIKGNVWQQVEVKPCQVPPIFLELNK